MSNATVESILSVPGRRKGVAPTIRKLKLRHPELTDSDIARKVGCRPSNVTGVLKTFLGKTSQETLADFQANKADCYDALQHRLLSSISPAKLAKAPMQSLVLSSAILEDKARLVRGQATGINVNVLLDVAQAIRESRAASAPNPRTIGVTTPSSE